MSSPDPCICLACGRTRADQETHVRLQEINDYFTSCLLLTGCLPKDTDVIRMTNFIASDGSIRVFGNFIAEWYHATKTSPSDLKSPIDRRTYRKVCTSIAVRWGLHSTYDRLEASLFMGPIEEYKENLEKFTGPSR